MMHDQKITEPPDKGDCFTACVASVLGIPYDAHLDFLRDQFELLLPNGDWLSLLNGFAIGKGKRLRFDTVPEAVPPDALTIAGGSSPRGCKAGHAVVMRGASTIVHDPHPSRAGLSSSADTWWWFEDIK